MVECTRCFAEIDPAALASGYCSRCGLLYDVDQAIENSYAEALWSDNMREQAEDNRRWGIR